ncbi:MAG: GTPase HflX [Rhodospirillales bacterium]
MLIHPYQKRGGGPDVRTPDARLEEAVGLCNAIALDIVDARTVALSRIRPATLIGSGIVEEIAAEIEAEEIGLIVVDGSLTPIQQRNLERAWKCKVIDRTALILEIFGERAATREGRMQVELASLTYQRSRLVRSWTHLERQRGGYGFLGGPGESQIESDRRQIDDRVIRIKNDLEKVVRTRTLHRSARKKVPYPIVALVGYTNAGKSTLFNRLTKSTVDARDQVFATLDPTMRRLDLPSGKSIILSDTVGFISDLPTMLVAAFRATLEEVVEADVIIHVRDIANPDTEQQRDDVQAVLKDLDIDLDGDRHVFEALNKIDLMDTEGRERLATALTRSDSVAVSAVTGENVDGLLAAIDLLLASKEVVIDLALDISDGASIAWLYQNGDVLDRQDENMMANITVRLSPENRQKLENRLGRSLQPA